MLALLTPRRMGRRQHLRRSSRGSQLLEFAFALPILMLLVVGIWDFGSKFALKQKLTNAARQADRIVISTPTGTPAGATGCSASTVPCAVVAAANAVKDYLKGAGLDGSWIDPSAPSSTAGCKWTWTYSPGTNSTYQLDINTNVLTPGTGTNETRVTMQWPLVWSLAALAPAGVFPSQTSTSVTMPNLGGGCQL